jgi:hypothetical protein
MEGYARHEFRPTPFDISRRVFMLRSSAFVFALLTFGAVQAADAPTFESLDKNTDGRISLDEASAHDALFTAFKSLDTDQDGQLTKEEFGKYRAG